MLHQHSWLPISALYEKWSENPRRKISIYQLVTCPSTICRILYSIVLEEISFILHIKQVLMRGVINILMTVLV